MDGPRCGGGPVRRDSFEDLPERFAVRSAKPLEIGVF